MLPSIIEVPGVSRLSKERMNSTKACERSCHGAAAVVGPHVDTHSTAHFFMYQYKVVLCPKRYSHDWGACPYAHEKEKARRRDPQTFEYSSCICPIAAKGKCPNSLQCPYAHTLFEYWLHPARFRTQMCRSGTDCRRALCFFAHTADELRNPDGPGPFNKLPTPALLGMQQQQHFRGLGGAVPRLAAPQDMPWNGPGNDCSSSFNSCCSAATAAGSNLLPMPNCSSSTALFVPVPAAAGMAGSSRPLLMSGSGMLAPLQQQQQQQQQLLPIPLPANQAYLLQLHLQQQHLQQQQQLQQQAKLQAMQLELQQQQINVRAALHGMEQQQGVSAPVGVAAAGAAPVSNSFDGYPLSAFHSAAAGLSASPTAAGQPAITSATTASTPREGAACAAGLGPLLAGLASSMAESALSIGGGKNFVTGPCVIGISNSGSGKPSLPALMLAAVGQQQQQQP